MQPIFCVYVCAVLIACLSGLASGKKFARFPKTPGQLYQLDSRKGAPPSQVFMQLELIEKGNVTLTMKGPAGVWFAVAFGASMSSAEAMIYSTGQKGALPMSPVDYKLRGETGSKVNPTSIQAWQILQKQATPSGVLIKATRDMFIHSPDIHNFDIADVNIDILWARGSHQTLAFHADMNHVHVNMVTGQVSSAAPLITNATRTHGILMAMAWIVFAPLVVLSSRFRNMACCVDKQVNWFLYHRFFVFCIFMATVIGFMVQFKAKMWKLTFQSIGAPGWPNGTPHVKFGLACMLWYLVQVFGGVMRPKDKYSPNRAPWFIFHRWGGLSLWIFSCFTIYFGIVQGGFSNEYLVLFGMSVFSVCLAFVVGTAASMQNSPEAPHTLLTHGEGSVSVVHSRSTN